MKKTPWGFEQQIATCIKQIGSHDYVYIGLSRLLKMKRTLESFPAPSIEKAESFDSATQLLTHRSISKFMCVVAAE
jgi:hypothetical protein